MSELEMSDLTWFNVEEGGSKAYGDLDIRVDLFRTYSPTRGRV